MPKQALSRTRPRVSSALSPTGCTAMPIRRLPVATVVQRFSAASQ
jgi:hypothetical protein